MFRNRARNAGRSRRNAGNKPKCGISRTIAGWLIPMSYCGHVMMKKDGMETEIMQEMIEGKRIFEDAQTVRWMDELKEMPQLGLTEPRSQCLTRRR